MYLNLKKKYPLTTFSWSSFVFSYPPDKRPNYLKLGTATPFETPWSILVYDWSKKLDLTKDSKPDPDAARKCQIFVLRDPRRLNIWKRCLERNASQHTSKSKNSDLDLSESDEKGLLPVQVCRFQLQLAVNSASHLEFYTPELLQKR